MIKRAFDIASNTLNQVKVWFSWIMHEETHLLDCIRNIKMGES